MQKKILEQIRELSRDRKRRMRFLRTLAVVSALVFTGVLWNLKLTGITMSNEAFCGMEEHVHTEECGETVLICTLEEQEAHVHDDDCYEETSTLLCSEEEHVHDENCMETVSVLTCTEDHGGHTDACYELVYDLICSEEHEHTEECYEARSELICTESYGHSEECYSEETTVTCFKSEHEHNSECTSTEKTLVCDREETEGHAHTEECYEGKRTCGVEEEHVHEALCYSNLEADVETAADWEATIPALGEDAAENVVLVARSQLGYTESEQNFVLGEDGRTRKGYTRYGAWYNNPYGEWDSMFTSFVYAYAGIPEEIMPSSGATAAFENVLREYGIYMDVDAYEPESGDTMFVDLDGDGVSDHTAIVVSAEDRVVVVQGDHNDAVEEVEYDYEAEEILGYGSLAAAYKLSGIVDDSTVLADPQVWDACPAFTWMIDYTGALVLSGDGDLCSVSQSSAIPWYSKADSISKIVIEGAVKAIKFKFENYDSLTEVVLPEGLEEIGNKCFSSCDSLVRCDLPDSLVKIGSDAFKQDYKLVLNELPTNLKYIGSNAFASDRSLNIDTMIIDDRIEYIGSYAFWNAGVKNVIIRGARWTSLPSSLFESSFVESVKIESDMTVLNGAFRDSHLKDVQLPDTLKEIGASAFDTCTYLEHITIPDGVERIGSSAFETTRALTRIDIPSSVKKIESSAFSGSGVERVILHEGLESIGSKAFWNTQNLKYCELPDSLKKLDESALFEFVPEHDLVLPKGLENVQKNAVGSSTVTLPLVYAAENAAIDSGWNTAGFYLTVSSDVHTLQSSFTNLLSQAVTLKFEGPNVLEIQPGALANAPYGAPLSGLSGKVYVDETGALYRLNSNGNTAELLYCPAEVTTFTVPSSLLSEGKTYAVTGINSDAFAAATNLTSLTIASAQGITNIADRGFAGATRLKSINGATTVTAARALFTNATIGSDAFVNTALVQQDPRVPGFDASKPIGHKTTTTTTAQDSTLLIGVVEDNIVTMSYKGTENSGAYHLLTGDPMRVRVSLSQRGGQTEEEFRVYVDYQYGDGVLPFGVGESNVYDGMKVTCHATDAEGIVYYSFTPAQGSTLSFNLPLYYQNAYSDGGGVHVWSAIVKKGQNEDQLIAPQDLIEGYWSTVKDEFNLEKTADTVDLYCTGDGKGTAVLSQPLKFNLTLNRVAKNAYTEYGRDVVSVLELNDLMELPAGFSWHSDVLEAVRTQKWITVVKQNVTTVRCLINGVMIDLLTLQGYEGSKPEFKLVEENGNIRIYLTLKNKTVTTEVSLEDLTLTFAENAFAIDVLALQNAGDKNQFKNAVTGQITYTHDETPALLSSQAAKPILLKDPTFEVNKVYVDGEHRYNDISEWAITLENPSALPYDFNTVSVNGAVIASDTLVKQLYIKEDDMEKMLKEEFGESLKITVKNATLGGPDSYKTVTDVNGREVATVTPWNTDCALTTETLSIYWKNGKIVVERADHSVLEVQNSLKETLRSIGFAQVSIDTLYTLEWDFVKQGILLGGEKRTFNIYAFFKSTLQYGSADWHEQHPVYQYAASNDVITKIQGRNINRYAVDKYITYRELSIDLRAYLNGATENLMDDDSIAYEGDVIRYQATMRSSYTYFETLPFVSTLSNSQFMLAPLENNPQLASVGLSTMVVEGLEYYVLDQPGVYENVYVGTSANGVIQVADSVTVDADKGTEARWYYADFNSYTVMNYQVVVRPQGNSGVFSLGNTVYLGDRENNRLYDNVGIKSSLLSFDKTIMDPKTQEYSLRKSAISRNETVHYRLSLHNSPGGTYVLNGADIYDLLPETHGVFAWEKGVNVHVRFEDVQGNSIAMANMEQWSIVYDSDSARYKIIWPDSARVTFQENSDLYIYVDLDFPDGDIWDRYTAENNGREVLNTLNVYRFPVDVRHSLSVEVVPLLQKGVYSTGSLSQVGRRYFLYENGTREEYATSDGDLLKNYVMYYVLLYNDGSSRLYVNDLFDEIPATFTYELTLNEFVMPVDGVAEMSIYCNGLSQPGFVLFEDGRTVQYMDAWVKAKTNSSGVEFSFSERSGTTNTLLKDEEGKYYLAPNQALFFTYFCITGPDNDAKPGDVNYNALARNTITMEVNDPTHGGVVLSDSKVSAKDNAYCAGQNDGNQVLLKDNTIQSSVSVRRGSIVPSITKKITKYTTGAGITLPYAGSATDDAILHWEVVLRNEGTSTLNTPLFTDTMEAPYTFTGDVPVVITNASNVKTGAFVLENIEKYRSDSFVSVEVSVETEWDTFGNSTGTSKKTIGVRISKDSKGNEVLEIDFKGSGVNVLPGGAITLGISTNNLSGQKANRVFTNKARVTLLNQEFTKVGEGRGVTNEDGDLVAVEAAAPVNVVFGFATSSVKYVEEDLNSAVNTNSDASNRVITTDSYWVNYGLAVKAPNDTDIEKLIIIDNLPEVGDHSPFNDDVLRNSAFKVDFNASYVGVTLMDKEGNEEELNTDSYTVQFSEKTSFTDQDWDGSSSDGWDYSSEDARSIRIILGETEESKVRAGATVRVNFVAVCDTEGKAKPGDIAWNSFGYHYMVKVGDQLVELEAMPQEVGVRIPNVPSVSKRLVHSDGSAYVADKDETFTFLIHEGEPLDDYSDDTDPRWNTIWPRTATVTVPAGSSESAPVSLDDFQFRQPFSMSGDTPQTFTISVPDGEFEYIEIPLPPRGMFVAGNTYTITEIELADGFEFKKLAGKPINAYTFVYNPDDDRVIYCDNVSSNWNIQLTKVDGTNTDKKLEGADFALYSKDESVKMSDKDYNALTGDKPERTITEGNETWYLARCATSDSNGSISFENLTCESYVLQEFKAPNGYYFNNGRLLVQRSDAVSGTYTLTVENMPGYELPKTGGMGSEVFLLFGFLIMAGSVCLLARAKA